MKIESLCDHLMSSSQGQTSYNPSKLTNTVSLKQLHSTLRLSGCDGCDLGLQSNLKGPVVGRGTPDKRRLILGEAPGLGEDIKGEPFCGPAGELLDKIFLSVGWDTNKDWYITNTILCRPIAPKGSGKQNLMPSVAQKAKCRPYLEHQLTLVPWRICVLIGKVAAAAIFPSLKDTPMSKLAGSIHNSDKYKNITFFIMYHTAAMLHAQRDPEKYEEIRQVTWSNIKSLKSIVDELEL
jgi:uracil-DNA glycosylase family 4